MNEEATTVAGVPEAADDVSLIQRYAQDHDQEALGLLFRRHSDMAYRTALRILRDPADAQDGVQAAFVEIMRDAADYRGGQGVRVWMMRIVANTCRNMIKRSVRRRNREERTAGDVDELAAGTNVIQELTDLVKMSLDRLPEQYRLPIWLHHYEGLPFEEVAGILAVPENTVRSYASRGVAELRKNLARRVAAVPAASIVTALAAIPSEAAPAGLINSIGDLVAGVGPFAKAAALADAAAVGKSAAVGIGLKVAAGIGLVAASAAVVGTVWTVNHREATTVPAVRPALPADVLFYDDFESGWRWENGQGQSEIVEGKGVGGSRAMRISWAGASGAVAVPPFETPSGDFDVSFKVFAEQDDIVPRLATGGGYRLLPYPRDAIEPGRWVEYHYAFRDRNVGTNVPTMSSRRSPDIVEMTLWRDGLVVPLRDGFNAVDRPYLTNRSLAVRADLHDARLQETSLRGTNVLYLDDVMVRRVAPASAAPAAWSRQWDFNSQELPQELEVEVGSWHYVPNGGSDGSGCMQTDTELFAVGLNIPVERLPVIVRWRNAVVYKPDFKLDWSSSVSWKAHKGAALIHGLIRMKRYDAPARPGTAMGWDGMVAYVGDGFVIQGREGELGNIALVDRVGRAPIRVLFRGPYRIDDLSIRSARSEEMPDVAPYTLAVEKIPPEKRTGTVLLPDLTPVPGQTQVTAEFFGPKP